MSHRAPEHPEPTLAVPALSHTQFHTRHSITTPVTARPSHQHTSHNLRTTPCPFTTKIHEKLETCPILYPLLVLYCQEVPPRRTKRTNRMWSRTKLPTDCALHTTTSRGTPSYRMCALTCDAQNKVFPCTMHKIVSLSTKCTSTTQTQYLSQGGLRLYSSMNSLCSTFVGRTSCGCLRRSGRSGHSHS